MIIYVCVGSGCHLKGSYDIIHLLRNAITTYDLDAKVELKASFCLGHCVSGVTIKVDDNLITGVNKNNFKTVLENSILPTLKDA
ncbi:MAG: (2Fe-2S) ferredoxin domain-containing protein [Bacillota bacterium]